MKVAIVGGGITGLAAAHYLSQKGVRVKLFEQKNRLGGLSACFNYKGSYLENFVHHFFQSDTEASSLIKELGLTKYLIWKTPANAIFYNNKTYPFTTPIDLLKFSSMQMPEIFRFGLISLYLKAQKNFSVFEKYSAEDWLLKYMGEKSYYIIWKPLLKKKFGKNYKEISMAWFWARIHYRSRKLGYLMGGLEKMINGLAKKINQNNGEIVVNSKINNLEDLNKKFDKILITTAPQITIKIGKNLLPSSYVASLQRIKYYSTLCLVLFLNRKILKNTYWLNVNDYKIPFLLLAEHTNFIGKKHYNENNIVYLGAYQNLQNNILNITPQALFKKWTPFINKINSEFNDSWVNSYKIFKAKYAQPVVNVGYKNQMPSFQTPAKNVYYSAMCSIYPQDRGVNYAVKLGKESAERLINGK